MDDDDDLMDSDDVLAGDDEDDEDEAETFDAGDDADLGFVTVTSDKGKKKDHEVEASVMTGEEVEGQFRKEIQQLSGLLGLSDSDALALLMHYHWKSDRLIELYMDNPDPILQQVGLTAPKQHKVDLTTITQFACEICCSDDKQQKVLTLSCGHRFCADCYTRYCCTKISEESECHVCCMANKCHVLVPEPVIRQLIPGAVYQRLKQLQLDHFMRDHEYLK